MESEPITVNERPTWFKRHPLAVAVVGFIVAAFLLWLIAMGR